jgi:hypothetical protein
LPLPRREVALAVERRIHPSAGESCVKLPDESGVPVAVSGSLVVGTMKKSV